ncbi:autophagy-related protein 2 homolog B-like, partial [Pteropus vampyrus]|uniref:Autophagy-related protein 2 homolog B-like n=1 Tax=Pteropus vampyrus TaxID=132908 RepID=A0A6P6C5C5_PTEVA
EESGSEEETLQYFSTVDPNYRSRRKKKLDSQNKNSQSFLSVLLKVYELISSNVLLYFHPNADVGIVDGVIVPAEIRLPSSTRPHWLEPTIYSSEEDGLCRASSDGVGGDTLNMLSVAVKILSDKSESNTKEFLIAVGLKGATLQHRMLPSGLSWHEQILCFLNIADEPVLGYSPPASFTTFHVHLWSCALDY